MLHGNYFWGNSAATLYGDFVVGNFVRHPASTVFHMNACQMASLGVSSAVFF